MARFALVGCGFIALMVVDLASADSLRGTAAAPMAEWDPLLDGEWVEATVDIPKCCPAGLTGLRRFNRCTQFYHCVSGLVVNDTAGGGGTCVDGCVKTCPDGTLFHEDIQVCTDDDNRDHPFVCQGEHECLTSTETTITERLLIGECGGFNSQDCLDEFASAGASGSVDGVCSRCADEEGSDPLASRCQLCCERCFTPEPTAAPSPAPTAAPTVTATTETTTTVTTETTITETTTTDTTTTVTTKTTTTETTTTVTTTTPPPTSAPTRAPTAAPTRAPTSAPTAPPTATPTAAPVYVVVANTNIMGPREDPTCTTEPSDCGPGCGPGCCGACSGVDGCTQVCNARTDCAGFVTYTVCGLSGCDSGAIIKVRGGPIAACTVQRDLFTWHIRQDP